MKIKFENGAHLLTLLLVELNYIGEETKIAAMSDEQTLVKTLNLVIKMKKVNLQESPINMKSTNAEDFINVLNEFSEKANGLRNLGVFADIVSVEYRKEVKIQVSNEYVSVKMIDDEQSGSLLQKDSSSSNPRDFSYEELLNGIPATPSLPSFETEEIGNNDSEFSTNDDDQEDDEDFKIPKDYDDVEDNENGEDYEDGDY